MPDHFKPQNHPDPIPSYAHYSCEEPEHPGCQLCAYSEHCQWCILKAKAALEAGQDYVGVGCLPGDPGKLRVTSLKDWVEKWYERSES